MQKQRWLHAAGVSPAVPFLAHLSISTPLHPSPSTHPPPHPPFALLSLSLSLSYANAAPNSRSHPPIRANNHQSPVAVIHLPQQQQRIIPSPCRQSRRRRRSKQLPRLYQLIIAPSSIFTTPHQFATPAPLLASAASAAAAAAAALLFATTAHTVTLTGARPALAQP